MIWLQQIRFVSWQVGEHNGLVFFQFVALIEEGGKMMLNGKSKKANLRILWIKPHGFAKDTVGIFYEA